MNQTPRDVLIARALYFLERAQFQLLAERWDDAADSIEKGIALLKEVTG